MVPQAGKIFCGASKTGQPTKGDLSNDFARPWRQREFDLYINLNLGRAGSVIYAADLTEEYVDFNKGDVGDPGSLGG